MPSTCRLTVLRLPLRQSLASEAAPGARGWMRLINVNRPAALFSTIMRYAFAVRGGLPAKHDTSDLTGALHGLCACKQWNLGMAHSDTAAMTQHGPLRAM